MYLIPVLTQTGQHGEKAFKNVFKRRIFLATILSALHMWCYHNFRYKCVF